MKTNMKELFERTTLRVTELQALCNYRLSAAILYKKVVKGYRVSPTTVRIVLPALNKELGTSYTPDDIEFLPEPGEEQDDEDEEASSQYQEIA